MVFRYPFKAFLITITLIIQNGFNIALAQLPVQLPHFTYNTPNTYTVSTPITPIAPTTTGGAVPATIFGDVSTFAGKENTIGYNDATGNNALFTSLWGIDIDASGNLYVSDNTRVRKITPGAVVTTLAGGNPNNVSDGNGAAAGFGLVSGLSVAPSGYIFVGDVVNKTVRQITPAGTVTNFSGNSIFNFNPVGVTTDQSGNIFVADQANDIIRKFTTAGSVSIYAGSPGSPGLTNGLIASSIFNNPADLKFDGSGNIYIVDEANNLIREISAAGIVSTVAGNTSPGLVNGPDASALFNKPSAVALDPANNIYVADANGLVIRMIEARGVVVSLAGNNVHQFSTDGIGSQASFGRAAGLVYSNGALFVADYACVRKIIVTGYSIDKTLPVGLVFDATTGGISGTPAVASPATEYTITGYNASGSYSTTITITVNAAAIPPPVITYQTPQFYPVNKTIVPLAPNTNAGGPVPASIPGQISSFAGSGAQGKADGTGIAATFNQPGGLAIDAAGNVYVADVSNFSIRKITPRGAVTTLANYSGSVFGLAVDAAGTVYVADAGKNQIEKISVAGTITIIAGSTTPGFADGTGLGARFNTPAGIAVDAAGNLYVADEFNNLIRKITPANVVSTFAGSGTAGETDGTGTAATFSRPVGIAIDPNGNVYVADYGGNKIRKIAPSGVVTTIAGSGAKGTADGTGAQASFFEPEGIAIDKSGSLYIADTGNGLVRRINPAGQVVTVAGDVPGATDPNRNFHQPLGIALDASNNAYVSQFGGNIVSLIQLAGYTIDKPVPAGLVFDPKTGIISGTPTAISPSNNYTITAYNAGGSGSFVVNIAVIPAPPVLIAAPAISYQTPPVYIVNKTITSLIPQNNGGAVPATIFGQVTTFAGSGSQGAANGIKTAASFKLPHDVAVDRLGNIYVADVGNYKIRAITPAGNVTTLAGNGTTGDADGNGVSASFSGPAGVTADQAGNLYVADLKNNQIRKIDPQGNVSTLAGDPGVFGYADGTGAAASFNYPTGVAVDLSGNIFVADPSNQLIRKVTPVGVVITIAGTRIGGANDGPVAQATFNSPEAIAVDNSGNLYVADDFNNDIRKITPTGIVSTIAGSTIAGFTDGAGTSAGFKQPAGIDIDAAGNIYVGDTGNDAIRMITPQGNVITVAGNGTPGDTDGVGRAASFNAPSGLSADGNGNVFVADAQNNQVREIVATGYTIDKPLPAGLTFDPTTGTISGTPTAVSPATDYTVTAYNTGGNSSTIVNITVISDVATPQTITFSPLPVKTYGDPDFSPGATSTNNTIPITYASDNTGVATIIDGQIHITGAGTSNITASQAGNDSYIAANPVTQLLTVNKALLTLTADDKTKTFGQANPSLTFSHTPFAYNETVSVLTPQPVLTTIATTNSAVGQYVISIDGATSPNYDITQLAGTLTINPVPPSIVVPNAFTPNGDGINDFWNIKSLTDYPQCLVSVYSRTGSLVFQSRGYAKPWDGTYDGSPVPTGAYYYIISPQSDLPKLSGYVVILR
jgi:gliding motility-associated-like protein